MAATLKIYRKGRARLEMDIEHLHALEKIVRCGFYFRWWRDCMGTAQPKEVIQAGKEVAAPILAAGIAEWDER